MRRVKRCVVLASAVLAGCTGSQSSTRPDLTPADVDRLRAGSIMTWPPADQRLAYPNIDRLADTRLVRRSAQPGPLPRAAGDRLATFRYTHGGSQRTIDSFMADMNAVGVIVVKDGSIVLERYADGHGAGTAWTAFSVTKSVTSLLYGVALKNGHIASLDEPVTRYLPELAGSAYDGVTLRHLLQMSSGVAWNPDLADTSSDTYQLSAIDARGGLRALLAFLAAKPRVAPPGEKFNYNTAEADLAGAVLSRATKRSLSAYLAEQVWGPFGMESDAHWLTLQGPERLEHGDCCLSATLRDYARIGLLALNDGVTRSGVRLLPEGWMAQSTQPSAAFPGYGYYWWLRPDGGYFASGSFGQHIEVHPESRTVVAIQSYWPAAYRDDLLAANDAFVAALIDALRHSS